MTTTIVELEATEAFDLDIQVEAGRVRPAIDGCHTDDGCGHTCQISACHSQR